MKTKTIEIDTIPQAILGITEIRGLVGADIQTAIDNKGDAARAEMLKRCLSALLSGKYVYSIEEMDKLGRKKTVMRFGKRDELWYRVELYPYGDYDDGLGYNIYVRVGECQCRLLTCGYWTMDELYDLDAIDFD